MIRRVRNRYKVWHAILPPLSNARRFASPPTAQATPMAMAPMAAVVVEAAAPMTKKAVEGEGEVAMAVAAEVDNSSYYNQAPRGDPWRVRWDFSPTQGRTSTPPGPSVCRVCHVRRRPRLPP